MRILKLLSGYNKNTSQELSQRIVIHDKLSLKKWSEDLNCLEEDLLKAVQVIGNSTRAVDDYLIMNRRKLE
jgi:hypothetical protein